MHMEQLQSYLALCFLLLFIIDVTPSPTPDANVLCISECGTCPLICSPPPSSAASNPPPTVDLKPPPVVESKPPPPSPKPSVGSEPPPYLTPIYHTTPPQSYSPPVHSPSKSCPPPSYTTMVTNAPPPPPPPPKLVVVPSTQIQPTDGVGQKNNSVPYYYFYTSESVSCSQEILGFLMLFTCFHLVFLFTG